MVVYHYKVFKSIWFISIKVSAEIDKKKESEGDIKLCDELWIRYKEKSLNGLLFSECDKRAVEKGLLNVADEILLHSKYMDKTVIEICSLDFDIAYYQEEGLSVAMMYWAEKAFGFSLKGLKVDFDNEKNRYLFEYNGKLI